MEFELVGREHIVRERGVVLEGINVPYALEFQVVDSHNGLSRAVKRVSCKSCVQEYGYE